MMTKEQIKKTLNVSGGRFRLSTKTQEGMIGVCPENVFIWVDDKGRGNPENRGNGNDGPRNIGLFGSVQEMLEQFRVDGAFFSESVLPDITDLEHLYS